MTFSQLKFDLVKYAPIVIAKTDKFTWGVSTDEPYPYPILEVKKELFENIERIQIHVNSDFIPRHRTQNVIGCIPAKKKKHRKRFKVVTAHYDHLGHMGSEAYIPGANDNASGIAMMLDMAAYYVKNPQRYSLLFVAFGGEEAGLVGSIDFAMDPDFAQRHALALEDHMDRILALTL